MQSIDLALRCAFMTPLRNAHRALIVAAVLAAVGGCASHQNSTSRIVGQRAVHISDVWKDTDSLSPAIPVTHTFTLHNEGRAPATIVSQRTRIDTVWRFTDTNDGGLPRSIAPGQTIEVAMRGTVRKPGPQRFFTDLTLDSGEVVTLEILVDQEE